MVSNVSKSQGPSCHRFSPKLYIRYTPPRRNGVYLYRTSTVLGDIPHIGVGFGNAPLFGAYARQSTQSCEVAGCRRVLMATFQHSMMQRTVNGNRTTAVKHSKSISWTQACAIPCLLCSLNSRFSYRVLRYTAIELQVKTDRRYLHLASNGSRADQRTRGERSPPLQPGTAQASTSVA